MILEREFSRRGVELRRWLEDTAEVIWESWRALERTWGEAPRAPWGSSEYRDRETMRAAVLADLQHAHLAGELPSDRAGIRARQKGRVRRALIVAMFPEDMLVDGRLPPIERATR